jgi:uncharacterized repeat protein (TIGR01451 family)
MRTLKRLGASALALGVVAASMVMTAPLASAHTGTLTTASVCNDDGTYTVTYTGETQSVPGGGLGHVATLRVGEVVPKGSPITGAPDTVTGNTTYTFEQTVPGATTYAQATAFLKWGDGATSDPIGKIDLPGNCTQTPVAPSGNLQKECANDSGHVWAGKLDNGTATNVHWRLVTGTNGSHDTVVGGPSTGLPLSASGLPDATKVWLQYNTGNGWVDEGSAVVSGNCTPVVVPPTGSFTVVCTETNAAVTIGTLDSGTKKDVVWTLTYNDSSTTVSSGDVVAVPALATLALKYTAGSSEGTVQTGRAPEACPPTGTVAKTAQPASGSVVSPGQTVTYSVTVTNTGTVNIEGKPAVDTLPDHVTLVAGSITGGGLASGDGRSITWSVTLAGGASETFTYQVTVDADAPARATLLNRVTFLQDSATTTHEVGDRSLAIVKSVTPTGSAELGDTLTYTLKVTAGGSLGQTNVVVSDYIPGYQPGRASVPTTYVPNSATCDTGTCTPAYDPAAKRITWGLGDMAPGTSRSVSFKVTIDNVNTVSPDADATAVFNSAEVGSTETPNTPSNEVKTPITEVLGVTHEHPPTPNQPTAVLGVALPHTGAPTHLPWLLTAAGLFLLMGSALIFLARKPEAVLER